LLGAARSPTRAPAVVLGLLLSADSDRHAAELDLVRRTAGPAIADQLAPLSTDISKLHRAKRLPLLGLALPTLQSLPASARSSLLASARALAEHDGEVHLFEFALLKALARHLAPHNVATISGLQRTLVRPTVAQFARPIATLISACARASTDSHEQAFRAFQAGTAHFSGIMHTLELAPAADCGLDAVSTALDTFAAAPESYRRVLLARLRPRRRVRPPSQPGRSRTRPCHRRRPRLPAAPAAGRRGIAGSPGASQSLRATPSPPHALGPRSTPTFPQQTGRRRANRCQPLVTPQPRHPPPTPHSASSFPLLPSVASAAHPRSTRYPLLTTRSFYRLRPSPLILLTPGRAPRDAPRPPVAALAARHFRAPAAPTTGAAALAERASHRKRHVLNRRKPGSPDEPGRQRAHPHRGRARRSCLRDPGRSGRPGAGG
jgi:hypothetical protein